MDCGSLPRGIVQGGAGNLFHLPPSIQVGLHGDSQFSNRGVVDRVDHGQPAGRAWIGFVGSVYGARVKIHELGDRNVREVLSPNNVLFGLVADD